MEVGSHCTSGEIRGGESPWSGKAVKDLSTNGSEKEPLRSDLITQEER